MTGAIRTSWCGATYGCILGLCSAGALAQDLDRPSGPVGDGFEPYGTIGPDVIVSTVGNVFKKWGQVGGITGYSIATASCNIGDTEAIWIWNTNQHPLIAQNLYRIHEGRIEQIGMSWLKHAFCAADGFGCGACQENPSCDWLGLFCDDVYASTLNGTQSSLGPRSEVNAATGEFPYPYNLNWQVGGDAIFKRLQVHNTDLDPALNPGALYFAEAQYICTDEAPYQTGTQYNNVSYRPVLIGSYNDGWNITFTGTTVQQQPALAAWQATFPDVVLTDLYVPDDGRMIIGCRATDNGDGTWHYEYALYNMNSHRSAQSFAVPIPYQVVVSGVGFHDVDYHSGEPYVLTDWPGAVVAGLPGNFGSVTWQCERYVENVNANAVRWGTLYNFRFDADTRPLAGNVTVKFFRPGTPASMTLATLTPSAILRGDLNCDAVVNGDDLAAFVLALVDPAGYDAAYPNCNVNRGDMNLDTFTNGADITGFLRCLYGIECP